jgi:hypothetical protein
MSRIDPPIDAHFPGDRARYLRSYYRAHREDVLATVRSHREGDG